MNFSRIRPGDLVWRSHDPELDKVARPYLEATSPVHKQPVRVRLIAHAGKPMRAEWELVEHPGVRITDPLGWEVSRREASAYLDRVSRETSETWGIPVDGRVEQGHPAERITAIA